jgi:hypothetical protein
MRKIARIRMQGDRTTYFFQTVVARLWSTKPMSKVTNHRSVMRKLGPLDTNLPEGEEDPINCTAGENCGPGHWNLY